MFEPLPKAFVLAICLCAGGSLNAGAARRETSSLCPVLSTYVEVGELVKRDSGRFVLAT